MAAGLYDEAIAWLGMMPDNASPLKYYYLAWCYDRTGDAAAALQFLRKAAAADPYLCFPNRMEDVNILQSAIQNNPADGKAPYYLGCLWYDKKQYDEAIAMWQESIRRDDAFPTVHRNLGIGLFNKRSDAKGALAHFEKAFALDTTDARVLMELDQLHKRLGSPARERLSRLEAHPAAVDWRDDLYLERAALHNFLGEHDTALQLILQRKFHPWEGGEGKVSGQYVYALTALARKDLAAGLPEAALEKLQRAQQWPDSLGEGKLFGIRENDVHYYMGQALTAMGQHEAAANYFRMATEGSSEPTAAMYYNDAPPEKIFYQGLAWPRWAGKTMRKPSSGN